MYQTTYHRPSSVDEAASLYAKGSESKYLAGGHTLIPVMKQRLASPSDVIDLGKIKELVGIEATGDTLTIKRGETKVFMFSDISRVAVGDPEIADVEVEGANKLRIKGGTTGKTTLLVWTTDKARRSYLIDVK